MTSHVSALEAIEKAIAGATPGPWDVWEEKAPTKTDAIAEMAYQVENSDPFAEAVYLLNANGKCPATTGCGPTSAANAAYIAACNPVAMREVLALARQAEALQRENAELREALEPFAAHQTADGLSGPGSLLYIPNDHPILFNGLGNDVRVSVTVGHIRRARALLGGSDAGN